MAKVAVQPEVDAHGVSATIDSEEHLTSPGSAVGTIAYMSPEQVRGKPLDARTDLFSFGAVLYEMCTGALPFRGESSGVIFEAILNRAPVPPVRLNPNVPLDLERILNKALEKDRNLRYQHTSEIRTDLVLLKRDTESARVAIVDTRGADSTVKKRWKVTAAAIAALLALSVGGYYYLRRAPKLTEKDTIVIADFANRTGDAVFDDTLKQALSIELEQSPFLNILSAQKTKDTIKLVGRSPTDKLTPELAREVCIRSGSRAVVSGSLSILGSEYVVRLNASGCSNDEDLVTEQAEAVNKEGTLKALRTVAGTLRTKLGESLSSLQKFDTPIRATTSSFEALKNYSMALKVWPEGELHAIPFLERAIEIDPNFSMAHAMLARVSENEDQPTHALVYAEKAYKLRDLAAEREKLEISSIYFRATGELDREQQTYELGIRDYPRSDGLHQDLAFTYAFMGRYDKVLAQFQEALRLDQDDPVNYGNLGFAYMFLGRFDEAKATSTMHWLTSAMAVKSAWVCTISRLIDETPR